MKRSAHRLLPLVLLFALLPLALPAEMILRTHGGEDHVGFGNNITIHEGESAGDVVCAFCKVDVQGDIHGDMVTFFGDVNVAEGRTISGDNVLFGGDLRLGNDTNIAGDLVLFGGDLNQAASATVHGDHVIFAGSGWMLAALLPFLLPIGIIWMIVYLIRRRRYVFPAYPGGRRF